MNLKNFSYFPYEKDRDFEIYNVEIEPGGHYSCNSHGENTTEYIVVFSGSLTLEAAEKKYMLGIGDAIRIDSDKDHVYFNSGAGLLIFCIVFTWK